MARNRMASRLLVLVATFVATRALATQTRLLPLARPSFVVGASDRAELPANDPRGVTGRFSVFAPNATEVVTVCEFRAELKKNLGAFRTRGTAEERHARYQASTNYLHALETTNVPPVSDSTGD